MNDCIYSANCTYKQCDLACPAHAEIRYWLDRCDIDKNSAVFKVSKDQLNQAIRELETHDGKVFTFRANDTVKASDTFSYCAICLHGRGTAFTGGVYRLNFHKYIDEIRKSWNTRYESDWLEYARIWSASADYLIISHLDYIRFNDFESQTLLTLMQDRVKPNKTTVVIVPEKLNLVGNGQFYEHLLDILEEDKKS